MAIHGIAAGLTDRGPCGDRLALALAIAGSGVAAWMFLRYAGSQGGPRC